MLEVKDVTFSYAGSSMPEFVFHLAVGRGDIVVVSGRSGAGKSTLLNLIAGFLMPDTGKIIWRGQNLAGTPPADRPLSMIFQDDNLFDHLSCRLNVALGLRPSLALSKDEWRAVDTAMDELGILAVQHAVAGHLKWYLVDAVAPPKCQAHPSPYQPRATHLSTRLKMAATPRQHSTDS